MKVALQEAFQNSQFADKIARHLLHRRTLVLYSIACFVGSFGLLSGWWLDDYSWFSRAGALVTSISIVHAFAALHAGWVWAIAIEAIDRNSIQSIPNGGELEQLHDAMQRLFARQHLLLAAGGTLVWGFGDLLGVIF